jgi:hypothetical protein
MAVRYYHPLSACPHPALQPRLTESSATGSPNASPPMPGAGSSRTWNYGTAAAHGVSTASAPPRTPGCITSRCRASRPTSCGASGWPRPAS